MAQPQAAQETPATPLEQLSALFEEDMAAVNAQILKHMESPVQLIPQLATYLIAAGGKRIRPLLTLAATQLYEGDMTRAHGLAACVEFIHTATLLHDDVVDESDERRGQKAANLVFGNQASVLVGDFLFSRAFQLMTADGSLEILKILSDASAVIAEGEVMQLTTANNLETTQEDYIAVINAKTAALFAAACEVGPVIAKAGPHEAEAMTTYGRNLGIAFQIADDALDYSADRAKLGKAVGDDFREGKMTLPVILALENADDQEHEFWTRTIKDQTQTPEDLQTAQEILTNHNAIERSLQIAQEYATQAQLALDETPEDNTKVWGLLSAILNYTIERNY